MDVVLDENSLRAGGDMDAEIGSSTPITQGLSAMNLPSFLAGKLT
jgi:hypothetical protein